MLKLLTVFLVSLFSFTLSSQTQAQAYDLVQSDTENVFEDFGEEDDEFIEQEEDERYFRYGRFVSLGFGAGFTGVTGNRGQLYDGGTPTIKVNFVYFFDFNYAMNIAYVTSAHSFFIDDGAVGEADVTVDRWIYDIRYYFNTKDLSSLITTLNPFLFAGVGSWSRVHKFVDQGSSNKESAIGFSGGGGFDIKISRGTYIGIEGRYSMVPFDDRNTTFFQQFGFQDLSGDFFDLTASLTFTW